MNYQYSVRDPLGHVLNGRLDAASRRTPPSSFNRRLPGAGPGRGRRRGAVRQPRFPQRHHLRHGPACDHGRYGDHALRGGGRDPRAGAEPGPASGAGDFKDASSPARISPWLWPAFPKFRQDLRLAGQGQRGHRHAGPDAERMPAISARRRRAAARSARRWPTRR